MGRLVWEYEVGLRENTVNPNYAKTLKTRSLKRNTYTALYVKTMVLRMRS